MLHSGDWRDAGCYGAADAVLVPFERSRVASHTDGNRQLAGAACASTAPRCRPCNASPVGWWCACSAPRPKPGPVLAGARGCCGAGFVIDLRGQPVAPFEGTVELRPFEIATLQLADH